MKVCDGLHLLRQMEAPACSRRAVRSYCRSVQMACIVRGAGLLQGPEPNAVHQKHLDGFQSLFEICVGTACSIAKLWCFPFSTTLDIWWQRTM
mmetsp:Transcript_6413/g.11208  ORF Transcript_6413/g.11208 Transcript_6413/m.11208 type:complete len:93 (-) Transcript_6413:79-357(-)